MSKLFYFNRNYNKTYTTLQILNLLQNYFAEFGDSNIPDVTDSETGELINLNNITYNNNSYTLSQILDILPYIKNNSQNITLNI